MKYFREAAVKVIVLILAYILALIIYHAVNIPTSFDDHIINEPETKISIDEAINTVLGGEPYDFSDIRSRYSAADFVLSKTISYVTAKKLLIFMFVYGIFAGVVCWFLGIGTFISKCREVCGLSSGWYAEIEKTLVNKDVTVRTTFSDGSSYDSHPGEGLSCMLQFMLFVFKFSFFGSIALYYGFILPIIILIDIIIGIFAFIGSLFSKA